MLFESYYNLYCEALSQIVWHFTPAAADILRQNKFSLSMEQGADVTKTKPFFLSTARSKSTYYADHSGGVMLKLDGDALNKKYKGRAFDYWGSEYKTREKGKHEMEDRLYSDKPVIPDARKYILQVQAWGGLRSTIREIKEVEELCEQYNIPYVYFGSQRDFLQNKNPRKSIAEVKEIPSPEPSFSKYETGRKKAHREILLFLTQLRDPLRSYEGYDANLRLGADITNHIRRSHDRSAIFLKQIIARLLKKLKLKSIDDLVKLRLSQKTEMDRYGQEVRYLNYLRKKFHKIMETDEDNFDEEYNFNTAYQGGDRAKLRALSNAIRAKDKSALDQIIDEAIDKQNEKLQRIKNTLMQIPLKDLRPMKKDNSWKEVQI
jgi:hypothetical protein